MRTFGHLDTAIHIEDEKSNDPGSNNDSIKKARYLYFATVDRSCLPPRGGRCQGKNLGAQSNR